MLTLKVGDQLPSISISCSDDGAVVDLSTAVLVTIIATRNGQPAFTVAGTHNSTGIVTADWPAGSTDTPGMIVLEVAVVFPGNLKQTWPGSGRLYVNIEA